MALVGIGSVEPSRLLRESGNVIGEENSEEMRQLGAVGDVCLDFFNAAGGEIASSLSSRVISIGSDVLRAVPRRVGVAGGIRKYAAIRGAVLGKWINVLITDVDTARRLHDERP